MHKQHLFDQIFNGGNFSQPELGSWQPPIHDHDMQKTYCKNKTFATTNEYTLESSSKRVSFRQALETVHIIFDAGLGTKYQLFVCQKQS